ncbi:MAG: DNA internalization-related competence protein ComEC/Rec2 [Chloroflexi bacterium]|nr:DNA internalization-related competence protein ComEC/Rec2 [Chloroflexota bacterium]
MTLVYISVAWVAGVYTGSRLPFAWGLTLGLLLVLAPLIFLSRHHKRLLIAGVCLAALLGGMLRLAASLPGQETNSIHDYNGLGEVTLRGLVESQPEPRGSYSRLRLAAREVKSGEDWSRTSGAALLYMPRFSGYSYGDMLEVRGKLETPPTFYDFDYREYLARQGIGSIMSYPSVKLVAQNQGSPALSWLHRLRASLSRSLAAALPEPQAALAQSMLLGQRSELPPPFEDALYRSGTSHLIAISGMHIAIVTGLCLGFGGWLLGRRRPTYILLALGAAWGYAVLAGMPPSAVRAAIMASLFLLAIYLGRQRSAPTALAFAAAAMVGLKPQVLSDVGFQLSVLAMAGLIFITPRLRSPQPGNIASLALDGLAYSAGPVLATLPLLAYSFHRISTVSLPATLLAMPAMPGLILTSAVTAAAGLVWPGLGQAIALVAWPFLTYTVKVVELFAALPGSIFGVGRFNGLLVLAYLGTLTLFLWPKTALKWLKTVVTSVGGAIASIKPRRWYMVPLLVLAVVIWWAALAPSDQRLKVSFLDVGQGDAALIQVAGRQVLVDGGPDPQRLALELGRRLPFWDRDIDLVVLTHPHDDHIGGLVEVLRRYRVRQVLEPALSYNSVPYAEWQRLLDEQGTPRRRAETGQHIELGNGAVLMVLHPAGNEAGLDIDNSSVVLRLEKGAVSFLFTGDIGLDAEARLATEPVELGSTVLKVAHHGSNTSTGEPFLAAVRPRLAVISVAADNRFGHPRQEVIDRLRQRLTEDRIYLTSERGSLDFTTDGERLWVKTEK